MMPSAADPLVTLTGRQAWVLGSRKRIAPSPCPFPCPCPSLQAGGGRWREPQGGEAGGAGSAPWPRRMRPQLLGLQGRKRRRERERGHRPPPGSRWPGEGGDAGMSAMRRRRLRPACVGPAPPHRLVSNPGLHRDADANQGGDGVTALGDEEWQGRGLRVEQRRRLPRRERRRPRRVGRRRRRPVPA